MQNICKKMSKRKVVKTGNLNIKSQKLDEDVKFNQKRLQNQYGMELPNDLFQFWKFCQKCNSKNPLTALSILDLNLVGPFCYLHDHSLKSDSLPCYYHMQWRYYYDVPEFLTVMTSSEPNTRRFHIGYFRDNPTTTDTSIVVSNSGEDANLSILGDNLFCAIYTKIKNALKKAEKQRKQALISFQKSLEEFAQKVNFNLDPKSTIVKARQKRVVAKTFHGAGIVVPIVNEVGYRPLHHTDEKLKQLMKKIVDAKTDNDRMTAFEPIHEMMNFIQFANDECDYGMGFELGIDLFCNGSSYFHKLIKLLLPMAYQLLNRNLYATICESHLADRRKENVERNT